MHRKFITKHMGLTTFFARRNKLSETKQAIIQNLFWAVAGKVVQLLSGLLVGIIVARYLGPERYGLMNYVISYVFLFQTFSVLGLDQIEVREIAKGTVSSQKILGTAFGTRIISSLLFVGLSIITSLILDADIYTTQLIAIYSLTIVMNSFNVIRNYFFAIVQNEYVVKSEIARTAIGIVIKLALLLFNANLTWFMVAYALDGALLSFGYITAYRVKIGHLREWTFDAYYMRQLLKESLPLRLTGVAVIVYQRIDQVMIGQMVNKEALGYFSVSSRFVEILIFIPLILAQTITPILVKAREKSQNDYKTKAQQFMNMTVWLSLISAILTSCVSYWLVKLTFGQAYLPAVPVLQIMTFKSAAVALSTTAGAMLITEGLQRYAIFRDSMGCAVSIILNYLFLPYYGIIAAAFVSIVSTVAAGYIADAFIPAYRHLFLYQTRTLLTGWRDILSVRQFLATPK